MADMSPQEISEFLLEPHVAHLITVRPNGRPHVSPVAYFEENGKAFVVARATAVKFRNVRQNPAVALSIATDERPYKYAVLEGEGRLTEDNREHVIQRICLRSYGPETAPARARELIASDRMRILEVQINRVVSWKED